MVYYSSHLLVAQVTNMLGQYQIKSAKCPFGMISLRASVSYSINEPVNAIALVGFFPKGL